ncbi:protein artemis isoform X4 [Hippocampus comes]|uniref:protein artemis isoform X4 n=1 Tax=Hippocampus comes TaxID=109280 RepID=UPI00094EBC94|nr:PREDICTED: protein artemis-like isoform X4 [Hippocampus comes]
MSSFPGRMKEYPYISLDRFDHENLHARAYFLSHCHKDHMRGIKAPKLKRRLRSSRRVKLYCSLVTKELLLSSRKHLFWEKFIVPLELESPTQISLVDEASGEVSRGLAPRGRSMETLEECEMLSRAERGGGRDAAPRRTLSRLRHVPVRRLPWQRVVHGRLQAGPGRRRQDGTPALGQQGEGHPERLRGLHLLRPALLPDSFPGKRRTEESKHIPALFIWLCAKYKNKIDRVTKKNPPTPKKGNKSSPRCPNFPPNHVSMTTGNDKSSQGMIGLTVMSLLTAPALACVHAQEACVSAVLRLAGDWIARSALHVVWLNCKAAYGYEYLFTRLGREFNTRVHVNNLLMFRRMPEILSYVTTERQTQIHACRHPKSEQYLHGNRLPCGCRSRDGANLRVLSVKPTTMWFGERMRKTDVVIKSGSDAFRACFSFHSSYCEVKDFLSYLRPARVFANVVPMGRTLAEVTRMLQTTCRKRPRDDSAYKPLGLLKGRRAAPTPPRGETRTSDTRATSKSAQPKLARHKEGRPQDMLERSRAPDTPQRRAPPKHTPQTGAAASRRRASKAPPHKSTFKTTSLTLIFVPSDWESDDDLFDSSPPKKKPRERRRVPDERRGQTPAPPTPEEDSPQPVTCDANHEERIDNNFLDCTESNDDDSEEGGQSEEDEQSEGDESATKWRGQTGSVAGEPPKWEDFFTAEPLPDSQKSLNSQSPPGWRTPEASSEREDDVDHVDDDFSLSLSASASNHSSQNRDAAAGDAPSEADEPTPPSLDFDIPCTPDSKRPTPEQLTGLYRKLARGDDLSSPD